MVFRSKIDLKAINPILIDILTIWDVSHVELTKVVTAVEKMEKMEKRKKETEEEWNQTDE